MKDITQITPTHSGLAIPFALAQSSSSPRKKHQKLSGFAKVLAGGRVIGLNREKPFADRMIAEGVTNFTNAELKDIPVEQVILESVATNLEAGVKLIDKQEVALAKMGGRLSEMALLLNQAKLAPEKRDCLQSKFDESRELFRGITKQTYDHTALFSMGPSKPVTVVVPAKYHWEGLSIDRCDILKSGLLTIDRGKISPTADGLLLDAETFGKAFGEWRSLCAHNRLQWHLVFQKWQGVVRTLKNFLGGSRWTPPPFPKDDDPGPLKRPNLEN